ncbi:membrane protein [Desulfuromonas versatilis]|uniref:Membrane protein n=1 Tax=Desulfuromonas versatilis TaxID=2802975 RepID=A0ABN6E3H9_9BACT|nr:Slp/YeaY family lipoprotein [Desulfuromonas versatilis]BCR06893.1 membrane protein [Desulfuromonas versatilis]
MRRICLAALLALALTGCSHVLSKEALVEVDPLLEFEQVKSNPERYRERTLVVGGLILDNNVSPEGTELEVLRYSLDRWGWPGDADEAGGRFLARSEKLLDPALYKPGRLVTLSGRVAGSQSRPLQDSTYHYPVFAIGEIYLWPEYRERSYFDDYPYYGPPYHPYYHPPYYPYWHHYPYRYGPRHFRNPYWW